MITYPGLPGPVDLGLPRAGRVARPLRRGDRRSTSAGSEMVAQHRHLRGRPVPSLRRTARTSRSLPLEQLADLRGVVDRRGRLRSARSNRPRLPDARPCGEGGPDPHRLGRALRHAALLRGSPVHLDPGRRGAPGGGAASALVGIDSLNIDDTADGVRPAHTLAARRPASRSSSTSVTSPAFRKAASAYTASRLPSSAWGASRFARTPSSAERRQPASLPSVRREDRGGPHACSGRRDMAYRSRALARGPSLSDSDTDSPSPDRVRVRAGRRPRVRGRRHGDLPPRLRGGGAPASGRHAAPVQPGLRAVAQREDGRSARDARRARRAPGVVRRRGRHRLRPDPQGEGVRGDRREDGGSEGGAHHERRRFGLHDSREGARPRGRGVRSGDEGLLRRERAQGQDPPDRPRREDHRLRSAGQRPQECPRHRRRPEAPHALGRQRDHPPHERREGGRPARQRPLRVRPRQRPSAPASRAAGVAEAPALRRPDRRRGRPGLRQRRPGPAPLCARSRTRCPRGLARVGCVRRHAGARRHARRPRALRLRLSGGSTAWTPRRSA